MAEFGAFIWTHYEHPFVWGFEESGLTKRGWQALVDWFSNLLKASRDPIDFRDLDPAEVEAERSDALFWRDLLLRTASQRRTDYCVSELDSVREQFIDFPYAEDPIYLESILPGQVLEQYGESVAGFDYEGIHFSRNAENEIVRALDALVQRFRASNHIRPRRVCKTMSGLRDVG